MLALRFLGAEGSQPRRARPARTAYMHVQERGPTPAASSSETRRTRRGRTTPAAPLRAPAGSASPNMLSTPPPQAAWRGTKPSGSSGGASGRLGRLRQGPCHRQAGPAIYAGTRTTVAVQLDEPLAAGQPKSRMWILHAETLRKAAGTAMIAMCPDVSR